MDPIEKRKILQELGDIPEEVFDDLVRVFITQLHSRIPELKKAFAACDTDTLARLSHALKGTSGNLRLHRVHALATEMDDLIKEKMVQPRVEELISALQECVLVLKKEFGMDN